MMKCAECGHEDYEEMFAQCPICLVVVCGYTDNCLYLHFKREHKESVIYYCEDCREIVENDRVLMEHKKKHKKEKKQIKINKQEMEKQKNYFTTHGLIKEEIDKLKKENMITKEGRLKEEE